jgi:hypothetical protein
VSRNVIIVTPFFAPQSHAAVFRAYKLAKYLPRFGYTPHVVTTDTNYAYNEDDSLLEALPASVQIHRARYVEPSPRGLAYASGVADRRFITLKRGGRFDAPVALNENRDEIGVPSWRAAFGRRLRSAFKVPDAYWPWFLPATALAKDVARRFDAKVVMTSADPYTTHAIGRALQRGGMRWVADLRDPHTHCHHTSARSPWAFAVQRELEREAAERADAITVAAQSIALILKENYALDDDSRLHFIPTGLDPELLPKDEPASLEAPYLMFAGEYLPDYGDVMLRLFAQALANPAVRAKGYRLRIVGRREVNEPRVMPHVIHYGIREHVDFVDHVPQQALYRMLAAAEFAVLCYGANARWWCLPAKLVDYHALRKPVLAIVPNPSEARARLSETGLGIFLDGEGAVAGLTEALLAGGAGYRANDRECERYEALSQVREFARVFDGLWES